MPTLSISLGTVMSIMFFYTENSKIFGNGITAVPIYVVKIPANTASLTDAASISVSFV